ncbi:MAG: TniQ family protein [Candidatus Hodarchaeota archaeon]
MIDKKRLAKSRWKNRLQNFGEKKISSNTLHLADNDHSWGRKLIIPRPEESLLSWLIHQAWVFNLSLKDFIEAETEYWSLVKGLDLELSKKKRWERVMDVLPLPQPFQTILRERGLKKNPMDLQVNVSKWIDSSRISSIRGPQLTTYYSYQLRYCPMCWNDENERYFRISWRYPFVVVCQVHGIKLRDTCPSCNALLFQEKEKKFFSSISPEWIERCYTCQEPLTREEDKEDKELAQR